MNECGKKCLVDQKYAQFMVRQMRERKMPGAHKLTEYKCRKCGHWHIGNNTTKPKVKSNA